MIDTLCMGGGGIKGISFLGTLKYLEDQDYFKLKDINNFVGTSAGSILAFFLAIDYSVNELIDFVLQFNNFSLFFIPQGNLLGSQIPPKTTVLMFKINTSGL